MAKELVETRGLVVQVHESSLTGHTRVMQGLVGMHVFRDLEKIWEFLLELEQG